LPNKLKRSARPGILAAVGVAAVAAAVAGAANASDNHAASSKPVTLVAGTPPQSMDPGMDYTTQGEEINWEVYTGLLTYAHKNGAAGAKLIPGLITALPKISGGGKTYTMTMRKGLKYSNGDPVQASDFKYTMERTLSIPWGGSGAFITPNVAGAAAYAAHKAKTISGISTNNKTGKIVIHLTSAYGPFDNVLAFPSLGLVDPKTAPQPFKTQASNPPAGSGPFMVQNINVDNSFDVVPNPNWKPLPGIPKAKLSFEVKDNSNVSANALSVLNNSADMMDWADTIPGSLLSQIKSKASSRYRLVNLGGSTYYFFLNSSTPPFNNLKAREAVIVGMNQNGLNRLGSGTLKPACFFLPPAIVGHPSGASCPLGKPGNGNIGKAKKLVQQSGQANVPITVYTEQRSPRLQWVEAYEQELKSIGFTKVTLKQVADANYFTTIGEAKKLNPQTGFADWNQDFPNPVDFYGVLLDGKAILPSNNENFGQTNDPHINKVVSKLATVPSTQLNTVAKQWESLDKYTAKNAYAAVFGYQTFPFFTSSRIKVNYTNSIYGWDLLGISVK
jgi:peptide/nickel transport system substrate-binding protein